MLGVLVGVGVSVFSEVAVSVGVSVAMITSVSVGVWEGPQVGVREAVGEGPVVGVGRKEKYIGTLPQSMIPPLHLILKLTTA